MSNITLAITSPFVTCEEYARMSGIPLNTIRMYVKEGRLPIRRKDRPKDKPLINIVALTKEAMEQAV